MADCLTLALGSADTSKLPQAEQLRLRRTALVILVDGKHPRSDELVLQTLTELSSAVAMQYVVDHCLSRAVPELMAAVREKRLAWNPMIQATLSLLTHRFPGGSFVQFDQWWAQIEQAGQVELMIEHGFTDPATIQQVDALIGQLASPRAADRQAARKQILELARLAPGVLDRSARSEDPEVARSVRAALSLVSRQFEPGQDTLLLFAENERSNVTGRPAQYVPGPNGQFLGP